MFTFRERLAIKLLQHLKYNETEFVVCWRNNLILAACTILGVNQDELFRKICKDYDVTIIED